MKLHTITYGCQMSVADGEEMSRPLLQRGYTLTPELQEADAVLLNTCTVRQHAEDKALSMIGRLKEWKEERPERFLLVAGCAAERIGKRLIRRFPHIDLIVGARSIEQYPSLLDEALRKRFNWAHENSDVWDASKNPTPGAESGGGYVTIMRGCNYSCSYCIVPSVRGREIHRPWDTLLDEVRAHASQGIKEITLLGQTVNAYKDSSGRDFADLLRATAAVPGVQRLRFISPHPFYLNERLIQAMAETKECCPHLHLPVQSGSDKILKAMRRNYTHALFLKRTDALRRLLPDIALSTDLIVGFPGETEEDFKETLALVREADFCASYNYKYSPRETTEAAAIQDTQIPQEIKEERLARLLELTDAQTKRHLTALIGKPVDLLLNDECNGRTQYHFKARLSRPAQPGEIVAARITGATRTALKCELISKNSCKAPLIHGTV